MLADYGNSPEGILKILPEKPVNPLAHELHVTDLGRNIDFAARLHDAIIEFVVLVADQPLVEIAYTIEDPTAESWKLGTFDVAFVIREAVRRQPHSAGVSHGNRNRFSKRITPRMHDWPTYAPGLGMLNKQLHVLAKEIAGHFAMTVNAYNDLSLGIGNRGIQPGRCDAVRIVHNLHMRVLAHVLRKNLPRVVVGHPVGHDYFHSVGRIILDQKPLYRLDNKASLVTDWY